MTSLLLARDLGIGGEAHKQIDTAVKQGGFDIVNKAFELGEQKGQTVYIWLNLCATSPRLSGVCAASCSCQYTQQ